MIVYFSGTGNSRFVAEMIGEELNEKVVNSGSYIKRNERATLESGSPWIFVCPAYAWQIPRIFQKFISEAEFSGSKKAYFIITCGNDIGDANHKNELLCRKKGFENMGTTKVVMPENYVAMFPVPDKDKSDSIIISAKPVIKEISEKIRRNEMFEKNESTLGDRLKSGFMNNLLYKFGIKDKPFYADDKCIGCGKCSEVCILNNIKMVELKPVWNGNCTHCMACICGCPVEAIEYGRKSKGKVRYSCPEVNTI